MKRREVIQKLAYAVPGSMAFPSLLSSCNQNKIDPTPVYDGNVIIIGAGASGLSAAKQFLDKNISVKILEASERYGGRIRLQKEFFDFPMEQGADWIRGNSNLWYNSVESSGTTIIEYPEVPVYSIDGVIKTEDELANDDNFLTVMNFINNIKNDNGPDLTIKNAVVSANLDPSVQYIVDAITSNSRGSSFERVSIKGVSDGQKIWNDGTGKYLAENNALVNVLGGVFNKVIEHIKFNTPVAHVDYTDPSLIKLTDAGGGTHECTILIITVPINIIKAGDINFTPNLPINTTAALDRIGMDAGYKVMLSFYVNFWGKEVSSIYTDGTVPEYYAPGMGRSLNNENRILSALIMGKQAEALSGKSDEEIIETLKLELDGYYDGEASQQFDAENTFVTNWSDLPYIKGVKSYPMVSGTGAAKQYATPINNKLFFAGEATALKGNYGTVQGALDSADRVVEEVLEVIL
jgi:monoamine oxidase